MSISKIEMQDSNGNVLYPHTTGDIVNYDSTKTVVQKIDELQNKLSTLKAGLVTSVNNKAGSSLTSDSTIQDITNEVNAIVTLSSGTADANATAGQILSGSTAYVKGNKVTGSMANNGTITQALNASGSYTIPAGYHNGSGKVTANSLASQTTATATAGQILSGQTAYVNGNKITGSIDTLATIGSLHANSASCEYGAYTANDTNRYLYLSIPSNAYTGINTWIRHPETAIASKLGITSDKIVSGNNICGVNGTATVQSMGGARIFLGQKTITCLKGSSCEAINIDIGFRPTTVFKFSESANDSMNARSTDLTWLNGWWTKYSSNASSYSTDITGFTDTGFIWYKSDGTFSKDMTYTFTIFAIGTV